MRDYEKKVDFFFSSDTSNQMGRRMRAPFPTEMVANKVQKKRQYFSLADAKIIDKLPPNNTEKTKSSKRALASVARLYVLYIFGFKRESFCFIFFFHSTFYST